MSDYIVRATAANAQIRVFAATTKETVEAARVAHNSSPVVTAAVGRLMTAASMMGTMMKGEKDLLTIQFKGDGPMKGMTVTADSQGNVKGYAIEPQVILPPNALGKLDVGGAIGLGVMSVIKDMGLREPYVGQTELRSGEVGDDLTYYFATSEQTPSSVGLGVLMNKDNTVKQAGGFIIQLMPFAEEEVIVNLEKKLAKITSVTNLLDAGNTPEQIIDILLGDLGVEILDKLPVQFMCNCDKDRISKALISIGKQEINSMIDDGEEIEVKCHFCNSAYNFSIDELKELLKEATH